MCTLINVILNKFFFLQKNILFNFAHKTISKALSSVEYNRRFSIMDNFGNDIYLGWPLRIELLDLNFTYHFY